MDKGIALAVEHAGSKAKLARGLGISRAAVSQWKRVPAERVVDIESMFIVPRHRLRPDLYPKPGTNTAGRAVQAAPGRSPRRRRSTTNARLR